jgi:hypothetical protein
VTGLDNGLWVRYTDSPSWLNLGGTLVDAPSIVVGGAEDYFVGLGSDKNVWIRSVAQGWTRLAPRNTHCNGPSAVISAGQLAVACRGADNALWVGKAPLPATPGTLPFVPGFHTLGGGLRHGVSVSDGSTGAEPDFVYSVVGTDDRPYVRTDESGWDSPTSTLCSSTFTASEFFEVGGCRAFSAALWTFPLDGGDVQSAGGRIVGRPGVAVDADGEAWHYAQGTDGRIWVARQPTGPGGVPGGGAPGPFAPFGGMAKYGVAAVSLS